MRRDLDLGDGQGTKLYLVFGRVLKLDWGQVQLYYLFPLDEEVSAGNLVGTLAATGVALVLMLVAGRVLRDPAGGHAGAGGRADRGAAGGGLLDQRMEVRGEDDLAPLATSFNEMADGLQRQILRLEELSRLQRRFTSDVSHELRTPLTTVRMAADLIYDARDELRPRGRPQRRTAAEGAGPVRVAAGRPAGDQPVRRRVRRAGGRAGRPRSAGRSGWWTGCGRWPQRAGVTCEVDLPDDPVCRRGRRPSGGAHPAQPGRQRDRALRGAPVEVTLAAATRRWR